MKKHLVWEEEKLSMVLMSEYLGDIHIINIAYYIPFFKVYVGPFFALHKWGNKIEFQYRKAHQKAFFQ